MILNQGRKYLHHQIACIELHCYCCHAILTLALIYPATSSSRLHPTRPSHRKTSLPARIQIRHHIFPLNEPLNELITLNTDMLHLQALKTHAIKSKTIKEPGTDDTRSTHPIHDENTIRVHDTHAQISYFIHRPHYARSTILLKPMHIRAINPIPSLSITPSHRLTLPTTLCIPDPPP